MNKAISSCGTVRCWLPLWGSRMGPPDIQNGLKKLGFSSAAFK
jgi:hypothetical protein